MHSFVCLVAQFPVSHAQETVIAEFAAVFRGGLLESRFSRSGAAIFAKFAIPGDGSQKTVQAAGKRKPRRPG